ncbi:MAG: OmpA family protein [Bacteroidales bacterium]|jgi:chemotaxis protein MotB|nr:OmpA family protein [Bacteroidales bacterium]
MVSLKSFLPVVLMALVAGSCVTGKKYNTLSDRADLLLGERDSLKAENIWLAMSNRELTSKSEKLTEETDSLTGELKRVQADLTQTRDEYVRLSTRYADLQKAQEELVSGRAQETQRLLAELRAAQADLQKKENLLRELEMNLDTKKASLEELTFELEKRNARLTELEKMLDAQQKAVRELKAKVSEALYGFENNGLSVTIKDGKVYVSMDEKLLFKTGSYEIDANGRAALRKLGALLERNTDIGILVEGHTDDVPYRSSSGQLLDNWDLSVKRATTVVRVLTQDSKISPKRLTASGRGEYIPVDPLKTVEARQKNRRTEIILTPDLSELYKILESYE